MARITERSSPVKAEEPFIQLWSKLIHCGISGAALKTYCVIRETAWTVDSEYLKGNDVLAIEADVSPKTLYRHLQELEDVGAIEIEIVGKRRKNRIRIMPVENIINVGGRSSVTMHIDGGRSEMTMHIEPVIGHGRPTRSVMDDRPIEEVDVSEADASDSDEHLKSEDQTSDGEACGPAGGVLEDRPVACPPWLRLDGDAFDTDLADPAAIELLTEAIQILGRAEWTAPQIVTVLVQDSPSPSEVGELSVARIALGIARARTDYISLATTPKD